MLVIVLLMLWCWTDSGTIVLVKLNHFREQILWLIKIEKDLPTRAIKILRKLSDIGQHDQNTAGSDAQLGSAIFFCCTLIVTSLPTNTVAVMTPHNNPPI